MDLDVDACYRAFCTRPALRRSAVWRGQDNSGLLPSDLPSTDAETGKHDVLRDGSSGAGSWLPPVPALSAGNGARVCRLARDVEHRIEGVGADRPRRTR